MAVLYRPGTEHNNSEEVLMDIFSSLNFQSVGEKGVFFVFPLLITSKLLQTFHFPTLRGMTKLMRPHLVLDFHQQSINKIVMYW